MRKIILTAVLLSAGSVFAQDVAQVINRQPRFVTVQQRQCYTEEVAIRQDGSPLGAIAGGMIGSTIGGNHRDHVAGAAIGMIIGNAIGSDNNGQRQAREVCRLVPTTIQQGEVVTFSYQGRVFNQIFQ